MNVNYNIERLTNNPEIIRYIRQIEEQIRNKYSDLLRAVDILEDYTPTAVSNQDEELSMRLLSITEYSEQLSQDIKLLVETADKVISDLSSSQNGQGVRKKRLNK
jgi:3-methyladenine DNA glycosylase Tag